MRRFRTLALAVLFASLALAAPVLPAAARVQQAPASRVALDVPDGFEVARQFSGFIRPDIGASLVIVEMPAVAYEQLATGLTPEALQAKGIEKAAPAKLAREGSYLFLKGEQKSAMGLVDKFLLAFREDGVTALITANVPRQAIQDGAVSAVGIETILASARIAERAAAAKALFQLGYLGPFKAAGTILGTTHAYTLDGRLEPQKPREKRALLIVAPSLDKRAVPGDDTFAETLLAGLSGLKEIKVVDRSRGVIAGLEAIELVADAVDKADGSPVTVMQTLIRGKDGGYFRIVGQMPSQDADVLIPEMRKIAASFAPVE
jgi:hypothetical protein